ncbi:MAG: hypothetical protein AMJ79_13285 [Phycisphaerae bacterium SM23_30]|nr:MAG: hypothetical protein AMJ79_13285 [Phycisphaerae bacterium SM23_30]
MAITFDADEIFEMAQQIERNGARFYRTAAQNAPHPQVKKILEELADMELDHLKTFSDLRAELTAKDSLSAYDPDDQAARYLHAIVEGRIFDAQADPAQKLTQHQTPRDILQTAIGLEKDSIVFYLAMKERLTSQTGKEKIDAIIKEEMGHVLLLKDTLDHLD